MYRFGWFSTGNRRVNIDLLQTALTDIRQGEIAAEINFVFCNRERGDSKHTDLFLDYVEAQNIPLICFSYPKYKATRGLLNPDPEKTMPDWRIDYDREVMNLLRDFNPDLCILAGYMLITGPELCQKYDMINLHPAAPGGPVGTWQQVIWQLIAEDARETGALMNLVTPELDKGPVVTYCTFSIRGEPFDRYWKEIERLSVEEIKKRQGTDNPLFKLIREHGVARELPLITATMKVFSRGGVKIVDGQITDSAGRPIKGYNLTDEIDELMKGVH
jgi:phosphoribosylglycinamide formyltransferase-1